MDLQIECECGQKRMVSEGLAGAKLSCSCGVELTVPPWSEFRQRSGLPAHNVSPELVIEHLLDRDEASIEKKCVRCDCPTEEFVRVVTDCERPTHHRTAGWKQFLIGLVGLVGLGEGSTYLLPEDSEFTTSEHGTRKVYPLPLRICSECRGKLQKTRHIKKIPSRVPAYARLLEKFPNARVEVEEA